MLKQKTLMGLYLCAGYPCLYRNAHGRSSPPADSEYVSPTENQLENVLNYVQLKCNLFQ